MAGSIIIPLLTGFDGKGIKQAENALDGLASKLKSVGRSAVVGAGSYLVGSKAVGFVEQSVSAAAQLEQSMSGVKTIFGDLTPQIQGFIKSGQQMGMTTAQTAKAVTFLGSVFKQTGMPMQDVIDHTETMVKLAADLSATYGYSVEEALTAMTATFRGEYDPIEKFGVAMKQQQVNAELAARGLKGLTGSALIAAQQQIRYEMILQRTTDAQGAFGRQSNNLAVQMAVLKAVWTNMQATLGGQLTPALSALTVKLQPIIESLAPHLARVFVAIGNAVVALSPMLPRLAELMVKAFDALSNVLTTTTPLLTALVDYVIHNVGFSVAFVAALMNIKKIQPFVEALRVQFKLLQMELGRTEAARVYGEITASVAETTTGIGKARKAQELFNLAVQRNAYILIASAVILVGTGIYEIGKGIAEQAKKTEDFKNKVRELNETLKAQGAQYLDLSNKASAYASAGHYAGVLEARAWQEAYDKLSDYEYAYEAALLKNQGHSRSAQERFGMSWSDYVKTKPKTGVDTTTTDIGKTVKSWFQTLKDEVKKQADRLKLEKLNLSQGLIDSVLNASDWVSAVKKIVKMTASELKSLQAQFDATAAGKAEAEAAAKDLADRQAKYEEAVQKRLDTIKSLTSGLADVLPKTYAEITADVGQFESQVVSATSNLKDSLKQALDTGDIGTKAYNDLMAYVNKESSALQELGRRRDAIVRKIEAAKSVYLEVANAVRGYGNITSTTTQQVVESYVKIIDGVEVTVSRTVDALQSNDLVGAYQKMVDNTKAFLTDLVQLKKMGLNATLFKQIIDAGTDAGKVTADAILAGGQDTVDNLNSLFGQLDDTGAKMADLTAQVMSDAGVTIVSGFIDGLVSQEKALGDQAISMAKLFSDAFNAAVKLAIPQVDPNAFGKGIVPVADNSAFDGYVIQPSDWYADYIPQAKPNINMSAVTASATSPAETTNSLQLASVNSGTTYNVTVNAGLGTDGAVVGQTLINTIKQYERNNGAVWVSA